MNSPAGRMAHPPELPGLLYIAPLGSGGYSDVYLYEQQMPRMKVAVKVLAAHGLAEQARHQFSAEANAMAQLADHPHIVQVFRADISPDGRPFLVMKYYPQPNLAQRARGERFSVPDVLRIGIQVASAVEAAHRIGILHRDIKPANILTGQYGTLGLTDFGIAADQGRRPSPGRPTASRSPGRRLRCSSVPSGRRAFGRLLASPPRCGTCSSAVRRSINAAATTRRSR